MKRIMAQMINRKPFFIGVAGGTASGKSSVCNAILESLTECQKSNVAIVCQDSFYRNLDRENLELAKKGKFNFDHPDAFDHDLIYDVMTHMSNNESVQIPVYDYKTNARLHDESVEVPPVDIVLFEGILVFHDRRIRDMFNMKIFVDADPDIRLARRVKRDIESRGRDLDIILKHYETFVKPAFDDFCLPSKKYADVIIPRGSANTVAISLIVKHIQDFLQSPRSTPVSNRSSVNSGSPINVPTTDRSLAAINVAAHSPANGELSIDDQENHRPLSAQLSTSLSTDSQEKPRRRTRTISQTVVSAPTPH